MKVNIPLFIALRYWRAKSGDRFGRLVTHLASLGITLGIMALIIVLSVMNGLENMQKQNVLSSFPHAIVSPLEKGSISFDSMSLPSFVHKAVPINRTNVIIQSQQGINAGQLVGVASAEDDPLLTEMRDLTSLLPRGEFNVIVGNRLAQRLNLHIGDKIRLMITENSQYTPFGRVPVQRLFTISQIYYSYHEANDSTLFANLYDVGRLLRLTDNQVQGYRLFLIDPFQVTELSHYFSEEQWKINDWREQKGEFFQAVRMEKNMMGLLVSLIIIVAISNIVTSLSLMVVDKQGEIAILQTQGLTKWQITCLFIIQGMVVGLVGAIIGAGAGLFFTHYLGEIIQFISPMGVILPTIIDLEQVGEIILASITLSLLCTLYPAYRAAKVEPAEALRYE